MEPRRRTGSARRCLFGPVEHEQLRLELQLRLQEMSEADSRRWNFDFHRQAPLAGSFQWEEVSAGRAAAFYQGSVPQASEERAPGAGQGAGGDQENCSGISNTQQSPAEGTPVLRKRTRSQAAARSGRKRRIPGEEPGSTLILRPIQL